MIMLDGRDLTVRNIHDEVGKPPIRAFVFMIMLAIHKMIFISTSLDVKHPLSHFGLRRFCICLIVETKFVDNCYTDSGWESLISFKMREFIVENISLSHRPPT